MIDERKRSYAGANKVRTKEEKNMLNTNAYAATEECEEGRNEGKTAQQLEQTLAKGTPIQVHTHEGSQYASHEDFHTIFHENLKELYQLSFLLTRDPAKADRCLVRGLEDCVSGNRVFREWARSWAKRRIVQNAIRELKPRPDRSNSLLSGAMFSDMDQHSRGLGGHFEIGAVLRLADFDRFVFVMSVLEHYSEHDCALLLECSVRDIREGRTRALKELADSPHMEPFENQLFVQEKK